MKNKNQIFRDWKEYCAGENDFDIFEFVYLLAGKRTEAEITEIYAAFDQCTALTQRTLEVMRAGYFEEEGTAVRPLPENRASEAEVLTYATAHLSDLAAAMLSAGAPILAERIQQLPVNFSEGKSKFERVTHDNSLETKVYEVIGDHMAEIISPDDEYSEALLEALLGMTEDYYLAQFIAKPLYSSDFDFRNYFELWRRSGEIALLEDGAVVRHRRDE